MINKGARLRRRLCRRVVEKVLKMDRPLAGGFLSLTALRAEGCGIALSGDEFYNAACGAKVQRVVVAPFGRHF